MISPQIIRPQALVLPGMNGGFQSLDGMGQFPRFGSAGGAGSLQDVIASAVFHVDATDANSYGGSGQVWSNLVAAPADGAAQSDYNFHLGASSSATTDDPTFNGTPGDPAAYWGFDGGDFFRLIAGNTTFTNACAYGTGGQDFTFAVAVYLASSTTSQAFMGNSSLGNVGVGFYALSTNAVRAGQRQTTTATQVSSTQTFTDATPSLIICAHKHSTNTTRFWVNSRAGEDVSHTFQAGSTNAGSNFEIGALNGSTRMQNTNRAYAGCAFNEFFDDTKAGLLYDFFNNKHARTYA